MSLSLAARLARAAHPLTLTLHPPSRHGARARTRIHPFESMDPSPSMACRVCSLRAIKARNGHGHLPAGLRGPSKWQRARRRSQPRMCMPRSRRGRPGRAQARSRRSRSRHAWAFGPSRGLARRWRPWTAAARARPVHAHPAAAAPPILPGFQTVILPGSPGYVLYPPAQVRPLEQRGLRPRSALALHS